MDPLTIQRLGRIRHDEIVAQSAQKTQHSRRSLWHVVLSIGQQIRHLAARIRVAASQPATEYKPARPGQYPVK
jgi:hypothetical protein